MLIDYSELERVSGKMNWNNSVWLYCERGTSTALGAEPVNAASNIMYLFAALAALWIYRRLPFAQKSADHALLIALTLLVGAGSASFHLFATQWSELAHMVPLLMFMMVYLAIALNRFLDMPPGWTMLIVGVFVVLSLAALTMTCSSIDQALQPAWSVANGAKGGATSCLNGSMGYVPWLLALFTLAIWLFKRRHLAASSVMLSALLFLASVVAHGVDHLYCGKLEIEGHVIGSHFIWHVLNGLILFTLMRTSMIYQNQRAVQEIISPEPKRNKNL